MSAQLHQGAGSGLAGAGVGPTADWGYLHGVWSTVALDSGSLLHLRLLTNVALQTAADVSWETLLCVSV
jgi:hypothetical protein